MPLPSASLARCSKAGSLGVMGAGSLAVSRSQQLRSFRLGRPWIYYRQEEQRYGDVHRKGRCFRYKYTQISRESDRAQHSLTDDAPNYWQPKLEQARSRVSSFYSAIRTPGDLDGVRPGRNIEDVERSPLEGLLFGKFRQQPPVETGYVIDPITNRKVPKFSSDAASVGLGGDPDVFPGVFESQRSRFSSLNSSAAHQAPWGVAAFPDTRAGWSCRRSASESDAASYRPPILESELYVADLNERTTKAQANHLSASSGGASFAALSGISSINWWRPDWATQRPASDQAGLEVDEAEELSKYTAFRSSEPDGKYKLADEPTVDPEELAKYQPFMSHEPDGIYAADYVEPTISAAEMLHYSQPFLSHEPDGKYAERHSEPSVSDSELASYQPYRSHEPDGKYAITYAESKPGAQELREYGPYRSHEPDGKYAHMAQTESADLSNHEAFGYDDSEAASLAVDGQESVEPSELRQYGAVLHAEPDGLPEVDPEEVAYDPAELQKYEAVRWNEPDGKPTDQAADEATLFEYDARSASAHLPRKNAEDRRLLDTLMVRSAAVSDAVDADTRSNLEQSKQRLQEQHGDAGMVGQCQHDLPEESSQSCKSETSGPDHTLLSAEPSTSHKEAPATSEKAVPTLYKVLVYDPTMQTIDTAETTSIVADNTTPLTPAEVLLRISNPSKFLPYFGPLQSQGFEIVSGAGDVLVFRKIREATSSAHVAPDAMTEPPVSAVPPVRPAVNPIDMTGGPRSYTVAASRFASPTGFVNYDLPPPRAPVSVGVHREEPVFSGPKEEARSNKKSIPKRLAIGAVWVAGVSYSLGVVGEYFRTGGRKGDGHRGL